MNYLVLDIETTGLDPFKDKILEVGLLFNGEDPFFVEHTDLYEVMHKYTDTTLVMHNAKFDLHFLARNGIDLTQWPLYDTMLVDHLLDENAEHSLGDIVKRLWGDNYKDDFWDTYKTYEAAPADVQRAYAIKDLVYTSQLYLWQQDELKAQAIPETLVAHVHSLASALLGTEMAGIHVDVPYLQERGIALQDTINQYLPEMRRSADVACQVIEWELYQKALDRLKTDKGKNNVDFPDFNWSSSPQLADLLYSKLALLVQKNEKTKRVSTDDAALDALAGRHPIIEALRKWRAANKIYTCFIEGTLEKLNEGRIYPSFNVNGTKTGRISHSSPNLGQLPSQGKIRGIYIPDPGYVFISADYSQLEVVILATLSGDTALQGMLEQGLSQHDITAEALGIARPQAKTINFAMAYRCSPYRIASELKISIVTARGLWDKYWDTYSGVKRLMDEVDATLASDKPIVSCFGRKRRFPPGLTGKDLGRAQRQAFNFLIQSTGGDITSYAFYLINDHLVGNGLGRALFTVHDEVLLQAREGSEHRVEDFLRSTMIEAGKQCGFDLKVETSGSMRRWED